MMGGGLAAGRHRPRRAGWAGASLALSGLILATGPAGLAIAQNTPPEQGAAAGLPETIAPVTPAPVTGLPETIAPRLPAPAEEPVTDPATAPARAPGAIPGRPTTATPDTVLAGPNARVTNPATGAVTDPVLVDGTPGDPLLGPASPTELRPRPTGPAPDLPTGPVPGPTPVGVDDPPTPNPALILDLGIGGQLEDDNESALRATLGATFQTLTRTQALTLDLGTALDFTSEGLETDDVFPDASIDYTRDTGVLILQASASYRIDDIEGSVPGVNFDFDETDVIDDDGTREVITGDIGVDIFPRERLGLEFGAFFRSRTFNDTEDPDLDDTEARGVDAALRYDVRPGLTFRLTGSYRETDDDGALGAEEEEFRLGGRVTWAATPRTLVDLGLSYSDLEITRNTTTVGTVGGELGLIDTGGTETSDDRSVVGDLAVTHALPNGTVGFAIGRNLTIGGGLTRATVNRRLALPGDADLGVSLGLAQFSGGDTVVVGNMRYTRPIVYGGDLAFSVRRDAAVDGDDQDVVRTRATLEHIQPLTPLSSVAVTLGVAEINVVDGFEPDEVSGSVGVTYNRAVSRDWALAVGYRGTAERDDGEDTTTDGEVFFNINRRFVIRP